MVSSALTLDQVTLRNDGLLEGNWYLPSTYLLFNRPLTRYYFT